MFLKQMIERIAHIIYINTVGRFHNWLETQPIHLVPFTPLNI